MADITITINDAEISKMVEEMIAKNLVTEYRSEERDTKYGVRKAVESAVKAYIYTQKDEIIERCVVRASAELMRKGLPKLIERMGADE